MHFLLCLEPMKFSAAPFARSLVLLAIAGASALANASPPQVNEPDPHKVDIAKLIACVYDVATYNDYAMVFGASGQGGAELGLVRVEDAANPFMYEYDLPAAIDVLGYRTQRVALASGAILAVLDNVKPQEVAKKLGIEEPLRDDSFKFMAMRVAQHTQEKLSGSTINTVISHEVSTVITHPNKVLVGCSYRVNTY